jgi:hypothetical protein
MCVDRIYFSIASRCREAPPPRCWLRERIGYRNKPARVSRCRLRNLPLGRQKCLARTLSDDAYCTEHIKILFDSPYSPHASCSSLLDDRSANQEQRMTARIQTTSLRPQLGSRERLRSEVVDFAIVVRPNDKMRTALRRLDLLPAATTVSFNQSCANPLQSALKKDVSR